MRREVVVKYVTDKKKPACQNSDKFYIRKPKQGETKNNPQLQR